MRLVPGAVPAAHRRGVERQPRLAGPGQPGLTPKRVVCAPNAFKGTLSALEAAAAMAAGAQRAGADPVAIPVADGGDGTLEVLLGAAGAGARTTTHSVTGPLGPPVEARLGWLEEHVAVVELAEAAGLRLLSRGELDPLAATSRGAGELVALALDAGARRVIVAVGGSASTDGGSGLLQALGVRLLDAAGADLAPGGGSLHSLYRLDLSGLHPSLLAAAAAIEVAADVRNPLCGPDGAAAVFAPQKGASAADIEVLERGLAHLSHVAERDAGAAALGDRPGTGAAGGCGFALALLGATLLPGAALVCDLVGLDGHLQEAQLVLTGEGRLDAQTAFGKAPAEVGERARRAGTPCAVIAGEVEDHLAGLFTQVASLKQTARPGEDPRRDAALLLERAAEQLVVALG